MRRKFAFFLICTTWVIIFSSNAVAGSLLIKEDFEDGPNWKYNDQFDLYGEYLADEWEIVSTTSYTGKYSAQSKPPGSLSFLEDSAFCYSINNFKGFNELFIRFWAKFSAGINNKDVGTNFMRFGGGELGSWDGEYDPQDRWLRIYNETGVRNPPLTLSLGDGKWHEYAWYFNFSSGIYRTWKDAKGDYSIANSVDNYTNVKYSRPFGFITTTWYFKGDPGNYLFWIDDYEVWAGMPGGQPSNDPSVPSAPTGLKVIE